MGENEGVEERHIHVVKASSLVPAPVEEKIHKLEKSMGETKGQLDKILSLLERRSPWAGFSKPATPPRCHKCHEVGHFMRIESLGLGHPLLVQAAMPTHPLNRI